MLYILVPRGRDLFGQHQESRPPATPDARSPRLIHWFSKLMNQTGLKLQKEYSAHAQKLGQARRLNAWCWPKGSQPLGMRMNVVLLFYWFYQKSLLIIIKKNYFFTALLLSSIWTSCEIWASAEVRHSSLGRWDDWHKAPPTLWNQSCEKSCKGKSSRTSKRTWNGETAGSWC